MNTLTGERCNTEYCLVTEVIRKEKALKLREQGWNFDWSIPQKMGYEVYELYVENSDDIQGMIAIKHILDQGYTHIDIVESAPHNVGKNGKYKGVGAHLFAIACKHSFMVGNEGYVQFKAKTKLIEHYMKILNAKQINYNNLYIDQYGAKMLIDKYFNEDKEGG